MAQLIPSHACAQTAVSPYNTPQKQEPIVLSPFVVSTKGDTGYLVQSSLSGSRLNTNLADLAAPISVFTQEFLQDTAVRGVDELTPYMTSTQISYPEANQAFFTADAAGIQIRGFGAAQTVNYFGVGLRQDVYNTGRIDQSRGPNSILYGLGSPGGVVNVSTNQPSLNKNFGSITLQARSTDGVRASIDYNQPLVQNRFGLRLDAVRDHGGTWRHHEYDHQDRVYLAAQWKVNAKTMVDAQFEYGKVNKSIGSPSTSPDLYTRWADAGKPLSATANAALGIKVISNNNFIVVDTGTGTATDWRGKTDTVANTLEGSQVYLTDFDLIPKEVAIGAGGAFPQKTKYSRYSVFITHAFSPALNVELAANALDTPRDTINGSSFNGLKADPNPTLPNGQPNPNAGRAYSEGFPVRNLLAGRNESLRLTASYSRDFGRFFGKHDLAVLFQTDWQVQGNLQMRLANVTNPYNLTAPENAANLLVFRTYLDLDGPEKQLVAGNWAGFPLDQLTESISGRKIGADWINVAGGSSMNRFYFENAMAVLQSRFLNNRLLTVGGVRETWQHSWLSPTNVRGPATGGFSQGPLIVVPGNIENLVSGHVATASAVFRATNWLGLAYNWSTSFTPPVSSSTPFGPASRPEGRTQDVGIKISFDKRISINAVYFETSAVKNVSSVTTLPSNPDALINPIWSALAAARVTAPDGSSALNKLVLSNTYTFDSVTNGYELELVANPTDNWRTFLNYSKNESVNTNLGTESITYIAQNRDFWLQRDNGRVLLDGSGGLAPVADDGTTVVDTVAKAVARIQQLHHDFYTLGNGRRQRNQVAEKWNLRTNYSFHGGLLRSVEIGGGVRYLGPPVTNYFQATTAIPVKILYGPKNVQVDLNVGFQRRVKRFGRDATWRVQLNVNNALDERDIVPMLASSTGQTITYRLQAPRELRLTSKFSF